MGGYGQLARSGLIAAALIASAAAIFAGQSGPLLADVCTDARPGLEGPIENGPQNCSEVKILRNLAY
jgi:hypothetical protein